MVAGFNKLTWTTRQIIGYVIYCGHCLNNLFLNVKYFFDRDDFQFLCRRFGPKISFVLSKPVLESRCEIVALSGIYPALTKPWPTRVDSPLLSIPEILNNLVDFAKSSFHLKPWVVVKGRMVMILSEEGIYVKDCNEVFRIALVLYEKS